ncbi:cell division protein ZapE [Kushneria phosphatilytica]|uniref:Cell division protein ZapE n=1 Tax=Kushneria phosphatilytica TaxID=657387 RepID=A0A1S1NXP7_9GAMM|nr:cell division protein ZapE [Kushneria phosphatilytica]OHV12238.1 cell division protein ZapE [Kushneria phosphatilytica]QEL11439.1 AFG1 family ATPase [Kushneria phosphatilytica]
MTAPSGKRPPLEQYRLDLERDDFQYDPTQEEAVRHLQRLYDELVAAPPPSPDPDPESGGLKAKMSGLFGRRQEKPSQPTLPEIRGLYFWGGVGRGKTWLMDTFHDNLPFEDKLRTHFHRFMQRVHRELEVHKGKKNPLTLIAANLAREARVICFDEFFVKDITDAMILANLLEALFAQGVVLVATSNIVPDELYRDGLQRSRFLPAIDLLNRHCEVVNVDSGVDYRLRTLEQVEVFHTPADEQAEQQLMESFRRLAGGEGLSDQVMTINNRQLTARRLREGVAWFDFGMLCDGPRSQNDYIELAREYHTVLLSGVPRLGSQKENQSRRFINLVDEFYDRGVKLLMSAECDPESLYDGGDLAFEFERTVSRLQEMRSKEYLALPHKP